ncbi:MAG: hypothetical protein JNJ76_09065 [Candidatus Competibacter sp.]|nr:hypothetical protein [Candidatus Competibacter sp.]
MSQCGILSGPAAADLIEGQLATVQMKGDQAYQLALTAIGELRSAFDTGPAAIGMSWNPNPQYSEPVDKTRVFDTPPIPSQTIAPFAPPADPENVLAGLDDLDDVLNDILAELQALIAEMPAFDGVTITDQYLMLFASQYASMAAQLNAVLAACPPVALLYGTLVAWMQDGAVGMPADVEDAIRTRAFAAEDKQAFQAESAVLADWQARGFSLPDGALEARLNQIQGQARDKKAELNRDIKIKADEIERDTRKFAIEKTMTLEQMLTDRFLKLQELARTVAGEWQANHIKIQLAKVEVYKAEVDAFAAAARALADMGQAAATLIEAKLKEQDGYIRIFEAQLKGEETRLMADVKLRDSDVTLFHELVIAEKTELDVLFEQDRLELQRFSIDSNLDMKAQELELQKVLETAKVTVEANSAIARVAAQLSAGWTSALSMSAGISNSTGYSNSSECSVSYSYQD